MMRDLQGMQRCLQEKEDPRYLKGRQTHIKSKLDLRRWNQRSSISQGLKVFQRSQGMQVIFAKDDQRILQLHSFSEIVRVTRKVSGSKKKARIVTKSLWQERNRVEQVVTTGCNPEDIGYETTVINACSRSRKSLPQLVEACLEKLVKGSSFDTREAVREYLLFSEGTQCGFLRRYVFGITHSFLMEWICENEELLVQGRVWLNRWQFQIEIDSGWKHAYERKQMGLQGITVAEDEEFGVYGLLRLDKD
ncbi:hypothetical protein F2Q69_00052523 [Brassica cretica]|uniref:Uncharacterized protein n=1 Tax=Brassica cretica TaxID=69181 RepID=A0A8S9N524_BRACR|nr:hypothetical protein F2Q69_00052523 [Brassica cretica]